MKGLEKKKDATELVTGLPEAPPAPAPKERERAKPGPKHREHIAWFAGGGKGEWDEAKGILSTHTVFVQELCDHFQLPGEFTTCATGKDGVKGRNCALIPLPRGLWCCTRYGTAMEEGPGWHPNAKGHFQCIVGKAPQKDKIDHADIIVSDALATDTFYCWEGVGYVQVVRPNGQKENLLVGGDAYSRLLRCRYHKVHHRVCKREWVHNATDLLTAIAIEEGAKVRVYTRLAHVGDKVYIDLGDPQRRIVEIDPALDAPGWRTISEAPVNFLRTDKMLPLPEPETGGTLHDLRPFVNIDDDDYPLLIGALLGCFLEDGTIPITFIIGGDGRCKTCLAIILLMLVDPSVIKGCGPPENSEDLMLAVLQRWIYFVDNVTEIKPWLSDLLCRVASGTSIERRTKYKNSETSTFTAKRPILLTSIVDVTTKFPDLRARGLFFDLPSVGKRRKSEKRLWRDFRAARPKILGALYTAVSEALRNLPNATEDDLPRLSDWAQFCMSAEEATGLPKGAILTTYNDAREASVKELLSSSVGEKVVAFADAIKPNNLERKVWKGTGRALMEALKLDYSTNRQVQDFVGEVRSLQTALESEGVLIGFRRSNGQKQITIKKV